MTHERDLPNNYPKELYPGQHEVNWDGKAEENPAEQLAGGLNIFKMLQAFAQEHVLDAVDKKAVMTFKRDIELESLMLDGGLDMDNLSDKQKQKLNEYYSLFAKVKLDSNMDEAKAKKVMERLMENETLRKKVKKKRWKDVKREVKSQY